VQRLGLVLFGLFFAALFVGVALAVGIGSAPAVPAGDIAVIEGAPGRLGEVTEAEFRYEMRQLALEKGLKSVPRPGDSGYDQIKREATSKLIGVAWVEAQAKKMGLEPTFQQVSEKINPEEAKSMKELGLPPKALRERLRWFLSGDNIQEMLEGRVRDPSAAEIKSYYEENPPEGKSLAEARAEISEIVKGQRTSELFSRVETRYRSEWRVHTRCADGFVVEECGNYPRFGHPYTAPSACYEDDPEEPAEDCPAPVIQPRPAQPGSIAWWRPEGERIVQRPVPPGGGDAETGGE
jgi:hypothetical protein